MALLYNKSPKKCRELDQIVEDLKGFLCFGDDAGTRPVRASGSRWISHKLDAMRRVLSKYGAYTNHLAILSEDSSVKATDRSKIRGYYRKWVDAKYIFGCAVFADLLAPCSVLSKAMQSDDLDILRAVSSVVKSVKDTNKLISTPLEKWPMYDYLIKNTSVDDACQESYQSQELKNYSQAKAHYAASY